MTTDVEAVTAVNTALYEAFETADVDRMAAVWDDLDPGAVVCVHPGWPMLRGRAHVLRSWSAVMAGTDYVQFFLTDVQVSVEGDTAVVTCTENILTSISQMGIGGSGNAAVAATNVFRRRGDGWRLQVHHGSPVLGQIADE
jgi:ketosteroid isomerase-like protein